MLCAFTRVVVNASADAGAKKKKINFRFGNKLNLTYL